jgi:hypothetical protein
MVLLIEKHKVLSEIPGEQIHYEMRFTRNQELIAQYKHLRKQLYSIDPRFVGFRIFNEIHAEDYEDQDDQMLILYNGDQCYGGACLRISTPTKPVILDLENDILPAQGKDSFSLKDSCQEMELNHYSYAEFNRIVLHPALRKGVATKNIFQAVLNRCLEYRIRYMFGIGDKTRTRLYRQVYKGLGLDSHICDNVDIPLKEEYEGIKMYLLAADLKKFYATPDINDTDILLNPITTYKFD